MCTEADVPRKQIKFLKNTKQYCNIKDSNRSSNAVKMIFDSNSRRTTLQDNLNNAHCCHIFHSTFENVSLKRSEISPAAAASKFFFLFHILKGQEKKKKE